MGNKIKSKIVLSNLKMFGFKYVLLDIFYHFFNFLHNKTIKKNFNKPKNKKEEIVIKKINNYNMMIDKNSRGIHRDLYLKSIREPVSTKIMESLLKKGDVVLDAGANIGYYVVLESKKVGNKGLVYAVEPIKENFKFLKKNVKLNNLKNVKMYDLAFNDKSEDLEINVGLDGNQSTPIKIDDLKKIKTVKSMRLDDFFKNKKKPNIMRMDIDGFEHVIFKGGLKTLDSLEKIFVELHFPYVNKKDMVSLLKLFKEKGFEVYKAVLEWERSVEGKTFLGKIVNYCHNKRSKPLIFNDLSLDELINSNKFLDGHLSLEVFLVKSEKNEAYKFLN